MEYWTVDSGPKPIKIYGPLERTDLPGLYTRVCSALGMATRRTVVFDVGGIGADAVAVEALCRLQLGARHWGREVRLRNSDAGLLDIISFMGLDDVIRPELAVEAQR